MFLRQEEVVIINLEWMLLVIQIQMSMFLSQWRIRVVVNGHNILMIVVHMIIHLQ